MSATPTTNYDYWRYSESKQTTNHRYLWPAVENELRHFVQPGSRVLDAGCGAGAFGSRLKAMGLEVCGCDLSESGVSAARESVPECRFEVLSVYDDFAETFGGSFDAVVSIEVIEHLYDPQTFVGRVRDALAPGGRFILTTPYHGYLKNLLIAVTGSCDHHYTPLKRGGHIKFWSPRTISELLRSGGFKVERIAGAGRAPYLWKSMVVTSRKA